MIVYICPYKCQLMVVERVMKKCCAQGRRSETQYSRKVFRCQCVALKLTLVPITAGTKKREDEEPHLGSGLEEAYISLQKIQKDRKCRTTQLCSMDEEHKSLFYSPAYLSLPEVTDIASKYLDKSSLGK